MQENNKTEDDQLSENDGEIIPSKEPVITEAGSSATEEYQTSNLKPETIEMEVHHHGHVHEKKKWKEYVFQFFMLFLAVFCGFLAEYQLEHTIENNREKQFMISLIKDLESDTAQFNSIKRFRLRNMQRLDSTLFYFSQNDGNAFTLRQMRFTGVGLRGFYQNSATLDQLKNAGGFRLIRKRNIVDSISSYDQQIKRMILRDKFETDETSEYHQLLDKMFDGRLIAKIHIDTTYLGKAPPSLETIIKLKEEYISEFLIKTIAMQSSVKGNLSLQETIKSKAGRLIALIKKEYHLEK